MAKKTSNCYKCVHMKDNTEYGSAHVRCELLWKNKRADKPELTQRGIDMGWCDFPYNFDPIWVGECKHFVNAGE